MSKTTVKKAIAEFGEQELRQLVLDIYSRSKEAKELLDFYAEPDIEKKLEEYCTKAEKEVYRYSRRAYRPRASKLNALIKKFAGLDVGDEAVIDLRMSILGGYTVIGKNYLPENVILGAEKHLDALLEHVVKCRMEDIYFPQIRKQIEEMDRGQDMKSLLLSKLYRAELQHHGQSR